MTHWKHCVRKSVRSTNFFAGPLRLVDARRVHVGTLGGRRAAMARQRKKKKKARALTSMVLCVPKPVQFDKQPPTLPSRSNVLRTLGSTISQATRLIQIRFMQQKTPVSECKG